MAETVENGEEDFESEKAVRIQVVVSTWNGERETVLSIAAINIWVYEKVFYDIGGMDFVGSVNGAAGVDGGKLEVRGTGRLTFYLWGGHTKT